MMKITKNQICLSSLRGKWYKFKGGLAQIIIELTSRD